MAAITTLVAPSGECYEVMAGTDKIYRRTVIFFLLAGMVSLQCKNCVIHIPERCRGELLTMGRYTNPASFTFLRTVTRVQMW